MTRLPLQLPLSFIVILLFHECHFIHSDSHGKKEGRGEEGIYWIGTGIHDITGPASQVNFMGYAKQSQTAHGIHMRLRSRAFIFAEYDDKTLGKSDENLKKESIFSQSQRLNVEGGQTQKGTSLRRIGRSNHRRPIDVEDFGDSTSRLRYVCFVSIDAGMGSDLLNQKVMKRLDELIPRKNPCNIRNTSISGTHTHSAPGGFHQYALYQITSLGFVHETMDAFVEGIAQSITKAYQHLQLGSIQAARGKLWNANINRSPSAYLLNPTEERELYTGDGNTDKDMLLLKMTKYSDEKEAQSVKKDGEILGVLNWFPVHGTSMNSTNELISGDNKGYASYLLEKALNPNGTLPGKGDIVAAFASTNLGDVSPNTSGPRCIDTGLPCDGSCDGKNELCIASGPGSNMVESTEIIGRRQFEHAMKLLQGKTEVIRGNVDFRHSFINISNKTIPLQDGKFGRTCPPSLGYSFAAGTTDGPGDFDFTQGMNSSNKFWNIVSGFLSKPSDEEKECHSPKPILLNVGDVAFPYPWDPSIVPISIFKVGQLIILNVPAEFTTMAGRRLRKAITKLASKYMLSNVHVTIAGLANSYSHYVTTFEEYAAQRYEGASTLYGPHTLSAYIQEFERLAEDLFLSRNSSDDSQPPDLSKDQISLLPPVIVDTIAIGKKFGSIIRDTEFKYLAGETAVVSFRSSNPRNNQRLEGTFLTVDKMERQTNSWVTKYVDGDWCTTFVWHQEHQYWGSSYAHISWNISEEEEEGKYRICHFGTRKILIGGDDQKDSFERLADFVGCSRTFQVKRLHHQEV